MPVTLPIVAHTAFALYSSVAGNAVNLPVFENVRRVSQSLINAEIGSLAISGTRSPVMTDLISLVEMEQLSASAEVEIESALRAAENFIYAMPKYFGNPDASIEQSGLIRLDWTYSRNRMIAVIFSSQQELSYAVLNRGHSQYGLMYFDHARVPSALIEVFQKLIG